MLKTNLQKKWVRKNYKILNQMQETKLVYLLFDGIGPPCVGLEKHLSWMGELWLNGRWRRGSVGGLRDKGSQGIYGKHNNMQGKSCLRVTPSPPFISFLGLLGF